MNLLSLDEGQKSLPTDESVINNRLDSTAAVISPMPNSMSAKQIKREKRRIWKNITALSGSFMCLFTINCAVAKLQDCYSHLAILSIDKQLIGFGYLNFFKQFAEFYQ